MKTEINITALGYGFFCHINFEKTVVAVDFSINSDDTLDFSLLNYVHKVDEVSLAQVRTLLLDNLAYFKNFRRKYNDFNYEPTEIDFNCTGYLEFLESKLKLNSTHQC